MEEWRNIIGYEGLYQVSNLGRVKSLGNGSGNNSKEKILKGSKNKFGYLKVNLYKDGKQKTHKVHRLVASAFIPNPNNLPEVNHKDEDKTNNIVTNIEYCDRTYNNNYGTHNDRMAKSLSIPILQFNKDGEFIRKWDSAIQAQKELGVNQGNISKCCKGKLKSASNYIWMYAKVGVFEIDINKLKKVA